jgi:hypothetical protein
LRIAGLAGQDQSADPDEVMMQVFAIWNVLQRKGIKYSDISSTTPSKFVVSQTVRFLDQSIDATQANCVDGSVLMASILQKIGINSHLVMVPGHCFLAFDTGKGKDDVILDVRPWRNTPMLLRTAAILRFRSSPSRKRASWALHPSPLAERIDHPFAFPADEAHDHPRHLAHT